MKINWKAVAGFAAIGVLVVTFTACSGVTLADLIEVDVPRPVQESTGEPAKVSLNEAPYVRERYVNDFTTTLRQFDQEIADAQLFADFVGGLLNTGLELAEGPLQGVPLGGVIFAALGGLTGLFLPKPGTSKEKEKSYNKGHEIGRRTALEGLVNGVKNAKAE